MRAPLGIKKHISPVIPEAEAFAKAIRDLTRAADSTVRDGAPARPLPPG